MVGYNVLNLGCDETKKTKFFNTYFDSSKMSSSTCDCGLKNNPPSDVHLSSFKNIQRHYTIRTGRHESNNIGFNLNTNVHFKSKKRSISRDCISVVLVCLLVGQGVYNYLESQHLKSEILSTRRYVEMLSDSLDSMASSYVSLQERMKQLESNYKDNSFNKYNEHSLKKRETETQITCSNCTNSDRQERSVSRGKHSHCKKRNGSHFRCYRTSGPFAIHLRGALPEISVRDGGIIAPWYVDKTIIGPFLLPDGVVGEGKGKLEIVHEGLYFIYAQIYYMTSSALNSYVINVQLGEGNGREDKVVAVCSAEAAAVKMSELSCYTAVVRYLNRGDVIYVTQRERHRRILFRDGKSFLGLVLLNSHYSFTQ